MSQALTDALIHDATTIIKALDGQNPHYTREQIKELPFDMMSMDPQALQFVVRGAQYLAKFTETIGYAAPHPKSAEYLPPELVPFLSITPEAQEVIVVVPEEVQIANSEHADELGTRWLEFISE